MKKLILTNMAIAIVIALILGACAPATQAPPVVVIVEQTTTQQQQVQVSQAQSAPAAPVQAVEPTKAAEPTPMPEPTKAPAVEPTKAPKATFTLPCGATAPNVEEPFQLVDLWESVCFPKEVKGILADGTYFCGAVAFEADYPAEFQEIEAYPRVPSDGNYITADTTNPWGLSGYCQGTTPADHAGPAGVSWLLGFITGDGELTLVVEFGPNVQIPLP